MDLERLFAAPYEAARAAKASGRKVIGVVSNNVPVELIHAAGLFPVQLAPRTGPTPRADEYMEKLFDPMLRSVFDQIVAGELDFLDAVVFPRSVDSLQRAYYYLCELERVGVLRGPRAILYDLQKLPTPSSAEYTYQRTLDLKVALEAIVGRPIADAALGASIKAYNGLRARIADLGVARAGEHVAGVNAMRALSIAPTLPPEAATDMIAALVNAPAAAPGRKVVLIGSAHHAPDLHALIAKCGGQVVGDFHWRGDLFFGAPVAETGDPLRALADHYWRDSYSARDFPAPVQRLVEFAKARDAAAAIFFFYREEEAMVWDYPVQAKALEAAGVRTLSLSLQPYPVHEDVASGISGFLAGGAS